MCEPLKGKINYELLIYSDNSNFGDRDKVIVQYQKFAKNVKSAIEGFLKEAEKNAEFENGHIHIREVQLLMKRWFNDVIE